MVFLLDQICKSSCNHKKASEVNLCYYSSTIQDFHVDVCVSDVSSKRKRQSTITTIMEVDVTDPDDLSQSIDESDLLTIVDAATEDFESNTGFTVEEIRLINEENNKSYLLIIIGSVVGGVILIVAVLLLVIIIVIVLVIVL